MAITAPDAQWDVNTRGRADDDFYEWVDGVPETSVSAPTPYTGTDSREGLLYDGSADYTMLTKPAGLSTTFMNSSYTIALRLNANTTTNSTVYQSIFWIGLGGVAQRVGAWSDIGSTGRLTMAHSPATGSSFFCNDATDDITDVAEHVLVMTRSGNDFAFYQDGSLQDSETVAADAHSAFDYMGISVIPTDEDAGNSEYAGTLHNRWPGAVFWVAIWESALTPTEVAELSASPNPFVFQADAPTIDYSTDTVVKFSNTYTPA